MHAVATKYRIAGYFRGGELNFSAFLGQYFHDVTDCIEYPLKKNILKVKIL